MTAKSLLGSCVLLASLAACIDPHLERQVVGLGPPPYVGGLSLSTPPLNAVVFGPCTEEFGMPDSRRSDCNLYYWLRRTTAPWDQRKAAYEAAQYKPGELQCWRTRGAVAECAVVSGPPHMPPSVVAPNNMGAQ